MGGLAQPPRFVDLAVWECCHAAQQSRVLGDEGVVFG